MMGFPDVAFDFRATVVAEAASATVDAWAVAKDF
jgi:hypothetical protein